LVTVALLSCTDPAKAAAHVSAIDRDFDRYAALALGGDSRTLSRQLNELTRSARRLEGRYTALFRLDCPQASIDAAVMIGRIWLELDQKLSTVQLPSPLDPTLIDAYKSQLQQQESGLL